MRRRMISRPMPRRRQRASTMTELTYAMLVPSDVARARPTSSWPSQALTTQRAPSRCPLSWSTVRALKSQRARSAASFSTSTMPSRYSMAMVPE